MARTFSKSFLLGLQIDRRPEDVPLGVQLAQLCVDANIPAKYLAVVLEVTGTTVYSWFRGNKVDSCNAKRIDSMISILKQDLDSGTLPVKSLKESKAYLATISGMDLSAFDFSKPKVAAKAAE